MNLWTLGMMYIVLNTVGTAKNIIIRQDAVNFIFTKLAEINKRFAWICMVLAFVILVLFWSPLVLMRNIISLIKGSFK